MTHRINATFIHRCTVCQAQMNGGGARRIFTDDGQQFRATKRLRCSKEPSIHPTQEMTSVYGRRMAYTFRSSDLPKEEEEVIPTIVTGHHRFAAAVEAGLPVIAENVHTGERVTVVVEEKLAEALRKKSSAKKKDSGTIKDFLDERKAKKAATKARKSKAKASK